MKLGLSYPKNYDIRQLRLVCNALHLTGNAIHEKGL